MKPNLLFCFLLIGIYSYANQEREIIKNIDDINSTGLRFFKNRNLLKSYENFSKAQNLSDSIQDYYGYAVSSYNLGKIYGLVENYAIAEKNYQLALEALKNIDDDALTAEIYCHLGKLYKLKNENYKAAQYFEEALKHTLVNNRRYEYAQLVEVDENERMLFDVRLNLCELYIHDNNLDQALIKLLRAKNYLSVQNVDVNSLAYFNYVYGLYFASKDLHNNAILNYNKAIELLDKGKKNNMELLCKVYLGLSVSQAKSGKSTEAYLTLLEQNKYKDKLFAQKAEQQDAITKFKLQIEDYKNNASLANLERLKQLEITNKIKKVNLVMVVALIMLLVSVIFIYYNYVSKQKLTKTLKVKNNELETAKNEALKSSELKSKFISNVSHELRTPLYGVVGLTSLLLDSNSLKVKERKHLQSLKYSGDYLLNLVNDILQVGKMESEKVELQNVSVNLKKMIGNLVHSFDYRLVETNNKIVLSIDDHVPDYVFCDKVRLSQILINLIGNSIKFTNNGIINVRVQLVSLDEHHVGLKFEIQDNSVGIPKDKFDIIFENFTQLKDSNTNYQGTGLGLSITKKLIELFKSKIDLKSIEGIGTTFSFEVEFEIDKTAKANSLDTAEKTIQTKKGRYEILIAEDNKINQIVTKNLLKKQGYSCTVVPNGKEALDIVKEKQFDLILMDINMPVMDGNEATQAIRAFNKSIPIVALTAADFEEIKSMYKTIGYNDIVIKPFDNHEFFQVISKHIQKGKDGNLKLIKAS